MSGTPLPPAARQYLLDELLKQRATLCLKVESERNTASLLSGDPAPFGLDPGAGQEVSIAALAVGVARGAEGLCLSKVRLGQGNPFDLHQLQVGDDQYWLLVDVSERHAELQRVQQSSNLAQLRLDRLSERERLLQAEHQALRESSEEMRKHQHMQAEFVRRLSHEFGTPISAVLGHLNLLQSADTDAAQARRSLGAVRRGVAHLRHLVESVLDQARLENEQFELHPGVTNLRDLVEDFSEIYGGTAAQRGLDWQVTLEAHGCTEILVDGLRLRQVLFNLVVNAFKFTLTGRVTLALEWRDAQLQAVVSDSGPGISAQEQSQLFTDYGRNERSVRGTGLGLSISREIALRMGGTLKLKHSAIGEGSQFVLTVPAPIVRGKPERPAARASSQRALVVEDDADLRPLLSALLTQQGCTVVAVSGLAEIALDQQPAEVALVDMHLGQLDGSVALRQLRASWPDCYLLALSADSSQSVIERARQAGADSFLLKPLDPGGLTLALQIAAQRRGGSPEAHR